MADAAGLQFLRRGARVAAFGGAGQGIKGSVDPFALIELYAQPVGAASVALRSGDVRRAGAVAGSQATSISAQVVA